MARLSPMEGDGPKPGRVAKRIIEDENLPSDLLERPLTPSGDQDESLFNWVMQLRETLTAEETNTVGDVLNDGVLISAASLGSVSREANTLTEGLRQSLKHLIDDESPLLEQARFVLALDVQNRVHNEVNQHVP